MVAISAWKGYTRKAGTRKRHSYYACANPRQKGEEAYSYSRPPNARKMEPEVRELELAREKVLARYRGVVSEGLEKVDGKERRAVYNALGTTVWAVKAKGDPKDSVQRTRRRRGLSPRQNVNKMMQQVQKMQADMQKAQEELARETVTASAGGGAVKATVTGNLELVSVEIDPGVVDPDDVEMLQDMVLAAVNEALTSSQEMASKRLGGITGGLGDMGLNMPGL